MRTTVRAGWALALSVLAFSLLGGAPAWAHHSGAMYDDKTEVTFKGVVKQFDWANPHIRIIVTGDAGGAQAGKTWQIDSTSTGHLLRAGWTRNSLKPGDHIEVTMNPMRTGGPIGNLRTLTIIDTGQKLSRPVF